MKFGIDKELRNILAAMAIVFIGATVIFYPPFAGAQDGGVAFPALPSGH